MNHKLIYPRLVNTNLNTYLNKVSKENKLLILLPNLLLHCSQVSAWHQSEVRAHNFVCQHIVVSLNCCFLGEGTILIKVKSLPNTCHFTIIIM